VAASKDRIVIGKDGSVRTASRDIEKKLRERAGSYKVAVETGDVLMLARVPEDEEVLGPSRVRVLIAGEIVSRTTMLEVINLIANAGWRGELTVRSSDGSSRSLLLDQGVVKNANSDHPDDLLGEVLYRQGMLDRRTLDRLLGAMTPEKRFGQLVVEQGILSQEQLFGVLQKQIEQTFYGTLLVSQGTFAFTTVDETAAPPSLTVHMPVQGLLMEGVQRIDEMALFRQRIPSSKMVPTIRSGAPRRSLDGVALKVLSLCEGSRTIEDIARETGFGEFQTTKAVYHLLQGGQIELRQVQKLDADQVRKLVSAFNDVLRDIFMAVATYGGVERTRKTLSAWIQGSGYAPFFGRQVAEDGAIDPAIVVSAMEHVQADRPIEALHQGLHELVAFALFSATTALPREQELVLARDVNRRLKAIRID
jgi:hypothetical protein